MIACYTRHSPFAPCYLICYVNDPAHPADTATKQLVFKIRVLLYRASNPGSNFPAPFSK